MILSLFKTDLIRMTTYKVDIFPRGKESYESF